MNSSADTSFKGTEEALEDAVKYFDQEFEMAGSLVELTAEEIAEEWEVSLPVAKNMKSEATEIHRDFVAAIKLAQRELAKVLELNKKYWV